EILAERKQWAQARELLTAALAKHPMQRQTLQIALADLARREGKKDEARLLLQQFGPEDQEGLEARLAWLRWFAEQPGATGRNGLLSLEKDQQRLAPHDQLRLLRELALAHYRQGNGQEATRLWQSIARRNAVDLQSRLLLFELALQQQDEPGAR